MKTLIIYAHPDINNSKVSYNIVNKIDELNNDVNLHVLSPEGIFDIKEEQDLILKYERIVFAFPFWWCNIPWNLKKWIDEVFAYGFAFGSEPSHFNIKHIEFTYLTTTGNTEKSYNPGEFNNFTLTEFMRSMQGTVNFIRARILKPFIFYGTMGGFEDNDLNNFINDVNKDISTPEYNPDTRYKGKDKKNEELEEFSK